MRPGSLTCRVSFWSLSAATLLWVAGCGDAPAPTKTPVPTAKGHDHGHDHHHAEKGPHEGALVAFGDDVAHLEVVFDAAAGKITAYVLDGGAEKPVKIKADKLQLTFVTGHHHDDDKDKKPAAKDDDEKTGAVTLEAVDADADGMATQFAGASEDLKGAEEFDAVLESIRFDKAEFKKQKFNWPEGNEHHHH